MRHNPRLEYLLDVKVPEILARLDVNDLALLAFTTPDEIRRRMARRRRLKRLLKALVDDLRRRPF